MKLTQQTASATETINFAKDFAKQLQGGEVIALSGDLGGGKTTFTKGLAQGLGITDPITSPTFMLERIFSLPSGKKLRHYDVYRLTSEEELFDLGWQELIDRREDIIVVEWADRVKKALPNHTTWINFDFIDKNKRQISINQARRK
ncbi:tRNA (adenosine(37)-N6)-threonylcarbamoyltransferase complex ATPase subunit type 1 TsaE [Patescibacteria group bacterium]